MLALLRQRRKVQLTRRATENLEALPELAPSEVLGVASSLETNRA
jgi:hypothetical protein